MAQINIRAQQIMTGAVPDQRRQSRAQLPVSAKVFPARGEASAHIAHLRDVNVLGAFFYSDLEVAVGDPLVVELAPTSGLPYLNVNCEAVVVRVEEPGLNGLGGIAVEFHNFMVADPHESVRDHVSQPFVSWAVNMVDQKFARRPELEICASRIQGAA